MTSVLICGSCELTRRGLKLLISEKMPQFEVCCDVDSIDRAIMCEHSPQVVVLGLNLLLAQGFSLIERILQAFCKVKILVVSHHHPSLLAERCLKVGARGYIQSTASECEIVSAITEVADGGIAVSADVKNALLSAHLKGKHPFGRNALSNRELEVLLLFGCCGVCAKIGATLHLSPRTVETHREKAKQKLGLRNSTEFLQYASVSVLDDMDGNLAHLKVQQAAAFV